MGSHGLFCIMRSNLLSKAASLTVIAIFHITQDKQTQNKSYQ